MGELLIIFFFVYFLLNFAIIYPLIEMLRGLDSIKSITVGQILVIILFVPALTFIIFLVVTFILLEKLYSKMRFFLESQPFNKE